MVLLVVVCVVVVMVVTFEFVLLCCSCGQCLLVVIVAMGCSPWSYGCCCYCDTIVGVYMCVGSVIRVVIDCRVVLLGVAFLHGC